MQNTNMYVKMIFTKTLLALNMPALNGAIFHDMVLKGPVLYVCLWEFDREHWKNNAKNGQDWRGQR